MKSLKMNQNKTLKLFKDYSTVIFGTGFGRGLSLLTFFILARSLSIEDFGIFSLFFTIMVLVWYLPGAIDSTYVRYLKVESRKSEADYLRTTFLIKVLFFMFLIILSFPLGFLFSRYAFSKPELAFYISLAIISGAFLSVFSSLSGLYQGEEDFFRFSIINLLFYLAVILIIAAMFLFKLALTLKIIILINTLVAVIVSFFGFLIILRRVKSLLPIHFSLLIDMFHFGKWIFASNLIYIILQRLDILVLAKYVDFATLGIYSAAVRVSMLASFFTSGVFVILLPRGSQALKSLQHLKSYLKEAALLSVLLIFVILSIIIVSPALIKVFFGSQYTASLPFARILLLEPIFTVLYTPLMYLFYAENQTRTIFNVGMIMLLGIICALLLLVPKYGAVGAAISIVLMSICGLIFITLKSYKTIRNAYNYL